MSNTPTYNVGRYFEVTAYSAFFTFGKYKGCSIRGVEDWYLRWCQENITDAPDEFYQIIQDEIERRKA